MLARFSPSHSESARGRAPAQWIDGMNVRFVPNSTRVTGNPAGPYPRFGRPLRDGVTVTVSKEPCEWRRRETRVLSLSGRKHRSANEVCTAGVSGLAGGFSCSGTSLFGTGPSADTRERRAGLPSSMSRVGGASRSASLPTRLETRTKESNLFAAPSRMK